MKIEVRKTRLDGCADADGLVVVIDVIRAFTTTAFAFAAGAKNIILVGSIEEAFQIHEKNPDYLLMGEVDGLPVKGFHFGNSPAEVAKHNLSGKTLILRTSSGTQGVVRSVKAERILTSSFVVAKATLNRIIQLKPPKVTFVITGQKRGGYEDFALADYLEKCLCNDKCNPEPFIQRVIDSPSAKYLPGIINTFQEDLDAVVQLDRFPFAMEVFNENGLKVLTKKHFNAESQRDAERLEKNR